jgi:hypothetical protein
MSTPLVRYRYEENVYSTYKDSFEEDTIWSIYEALTRLLKADHIMNREKERER